MYLDYVIERSIYLFDPRRGERQEIFNGRRILTDTHKNTAMEAVVLFVASAATFILLIVISKFKITLDYLFLFILVCTSRTYVFISNKRYSFFISYTTRKFFLKVSLQSSLRRNFLCKDAAAKFAAAKFAAAKFIPPPPREPPSISLFILCAVLLTFHKKYFPTSYCNNGLLTFQQLFNYEQGHRCLYCPCRGRIDIDIKRTIICNPKAIPQHKDSTNIICRINE